jgi:hypothetical protein
VNTDGAGCQAPPTEILTARGLRSEQSASIESGRAVAKVLPWGGPSEVYVFGAVHVDGAPERSLKAARHVSRLRGTPVVLGGWRTSRRRDRERFDSAQS